MVSSFHSRLSSGALKEADVVTVETEDMKKELEQAFSLQNVHVMTNYKELSAKAISKACVEDQEEKRERFAKEELSFLFLSNMMNQKGIRTLLQSFQRLQEEGYAAKLDFYGPIQPDLDPDLMETIEDTPGLSYGGVVENSAVLALMRRYDVFVFPSEYAGEGFPAVLVEAFAAGLPVISSDINHLPEIITEENGYLFPQGDVEALAKRMIYVCEHRQELRKISEENQKKALQYDARTVIEEYRLRLEKEKWPVSRTKVAIVLPFFGHGGAEAMVSRLASHLDLNRVQVQVICTYGQAQGNDLEKAIREHGVPIRYLGKGLGFSPAAILALSKLLKEFDPDVIHTHTHAAMYCAPYVMTHPVKMIHTVHNMPQYEFSKIKQRVMRLLYACGKAIPVAISHEIQSLLTDYYSLKRDPELIYNPVDVEKYQRDSILTQADQTSCDKTKNRTMSREGHSRMILTIGRLSKQKNQAMLIDAFSKVREEVSDVELYILGDGELRQDLERQVSLLGLEASVHFPGYVSNVEEYLKKADIFALSSDYEGLPLVILEAMAASLPIIATDVGGVKDLLGENGILLEKGDKDRFALALLTLLKNPQACRNMGESSFARVMKYDSKEIAGQYVRLYEKYNH